MAKTAQEKLDEKKEKEYYKKHKKMYRTTPVDIVFNVFNYLFFTIFTLSCIFPFYYLFINTVSDNEMVRKGLVNFYPRGFNIDNYLALREVGDLGTSFLVSLSRTVIGTILMVLASAFVGYLVTKQEMWHRSFWYRFLVITMYFNAGLIPTYLYMVVFKKLILPLSKPILATVAIFGAVGHWNSFQDSLLYMQGNESMFTLQHRLYNYLNVASNLGTLMNQGGTQAQQALEQALNSKVIKYTISMVTIIPIFCVYPFMQRYFEKGIMLGAVKG